VTGVRECAVTLHVEIDAGDQITISHDICSRPEFGEGDSRLNSMCCFQRPLHRGGVPFTLSMNFLVRSAQALIDSSFGALHVHRCSAIGADIDLDAAALSFAAAFLALKLSFAFSLALSFTFAFWLAFAFSVHFSFALALGESAGSHAKRDTERGDARGERSVARRDTPVSFGFEFVIMGHSCLLG